MTHDCERFERWLDAGAPAADAAWAAAHADGCTRCRAARALEAALAAPPDVATGPAFTGHVLFRVRDAERGLAAAGLPGFGGHGAWWLTAPAEPAAALALAAAALLVWQADALWSWGFALGSRLWAIPLPALPSLAAWFPALHAAMGGAGRALVPALLATLAPLAWLGSVALARWVERHVVPRGLRA